MKVLLVDGSLNETLRIRECIRRLGGSIVHAAYAEDAPGLQEREKPDLILLDTHLPDGNGLELCRLLRANETSGQWTPIVFVSAERSDLDIERGIAAGADDYLFKPVSEIVLAAKVQALYRLVQMQTSFQVLTRQLDTANQQLLRLSASDGLTGLPNRRYFDEALKREWRRNWREGASLALIMCDVDHFKRYNDCYGHPAGDECLRSVAQAILEALERAGDTPARYGGEEFAVILPATSAEGALQVAERMRQNVFRRAIAHRDAPGGQVTLSLGVACLQPGTGLHPEALLHSADGALYAAKHAGRNCVRLADQQISGNGK